MKKINAPLWVVLTLVFLAIISTPFYKGSIDRNTLSQYGDFIGGIMGATFAGLGFIIIALTYRHQLQTTTSAKKVEQLNYVHQLYSLLLSDIDNLSFNSVKGIDVFYQFKPESLAKPQPVLDQLNSILSAFENILSVAEQAQYENESIKTMTLTRIYFLYYSKVLWPAHANIFTQMKDKLNEIHGDARLYLPRYEKLSHQAIDFLAAQKLVNEDKGHLGMN